MIRLKDKLKEEPGFQYVIDGLELMSAVGKRILLNSVMHSAPATINAELDNIQLLLRLLLDDQYRRPMIELRHKMMELQDIQGTIAHLQHHTILDEVELFEIKNFAYLCMSTNQVAQELGIKDVLAVPNLEEVFELLDPDGTHIPNFYIYDSYHPELATLRKQLKQCQSDDPELQNQEQFNILFERQTAIQQEVITSLSEKLFSKADVMSVALERMGYIDVLYAKAVQARDWQLSRPTILDSSVARTTYKALFNPRLLHRNQKQNLRYQPIDIEVTKGVCLITGANMAGKTVVLKTLGVAQLMAQFAMYVPAAEAQVSLVEDVVFCIGDEQNEMNGLSSYASEIIKISNALKRTKTEHLLVLIDEPARTTNPIEGKAIVQSISEILNSLDSLTLITTHYSQLGLQCKKLRVKGFMESMIDASLTPENINKYMDYSLQEDSSEDVPHEAFRIATILGCDETMITLAQKKLTE